MQSDMLSSDEISVEAIRLQAGRRALSDELSSGQALWNCERVAHQPFKYVNTGEYSFVGYVPWDGNVMLVPPSVTGGI